MIVLAMCGYAEADNPPAAKDKPPDKPTKEGGTDKPTPKVATSAQRCNTFFTQRCHAADFGLEQSTQLICIDTDGGCLSGIEIDGAPAKPTALSPNRSIAVIVHARACERVVLAMDGAIGEATPVTFTVPPTPSIAPNAVKSAEDTPTPMPPTPRCYISYFPPRKPGPVTLSMVVSAPNQASQAGPGEKYNKAAKQEDCAKPQAKITNPTAAPPADPHQNGASPGNTAPTSETYVYEFYVPTPYGGALRLGLGGLWVPALGHSYSAKTTGMSNLAQIIDGDASPVAMELVVGYAPFVFDRSSQFGGRAYGPESPSRWAPYFGIGALSSSGGSKVEWLRSIYAGLEYELTAGSSVALTAVVRRVDGLANDFKVGDVVPAGTTVTNTTFAFGGAIVFNFTPAFFKFASSALPPN